MLSLGRKPRILITRLSAIGDCIHTVPLVHALRERFPGAHLAWATQGGAASLIEGCESLDQVIVVQRDWMRRWASLSGVTRTLRRQRFDVTIDPQSLTKSSLLGWLSGARHRIGFARGQARELSPLLNNLLVDPKATHVVDRYLELLEPMGIYDVTADFTMASPAAATASVQAFLRKSRIGEQFVLLNPGAGWRSKIWPVENYGALARELQQRNGVRCVVLWAGEQERAWATEIATTSNSVLAPSTTLPELAELCRHARFFVGSDTGPMHLAAAVGTACIALFGPTQPEVCGPYGEGHQKLQAYLQTGTSQQRRGDDNSAMRAITVATVADACQRMMQQQAA